MPRYFFNLRDGREIFDATGTELSGAKEMRMHMVATVSELFDSKDIEFDKDDWEMEALDESGKIIATMTFSITKNES